MTVTAEETRDAVLLALQGADGPLRASELADAASVKARDLTSVLPALIADGVVLSGTDGYLMRRGETVAAEASVEGSDFPAPAEDADDDEDVPPEAAVGASSAQDASAAGVTLSDVLAQLNGAALRVRADVILEANPDGSMRVARLIRVTGLG